MCTPWSTEFFLTPDHKDLCSINEMRDLCFVERRGTLLLHIREVSGSNAGPETGCPD
jgi:hypothetical protein